MNHPFAELIDLRIEEQRAGFSKLSLVVTNDHLNPHSVVHGAVLYALADTGMGCALYPTLAEGRNLRHHRNQDQLLQAGLRGPHFMLHRNRQPRQDGGEPGVAPVPGRRFGRSGERELCDLQPEKDRGLSLAPLLGRARGLSLPRRYVSNGCLSTIVSSRSAPVEIKSIGTPVIASIRAR